MLHVGDDCVRFAGVFGIMSAMKTKIAKVSAVALVLAVVAGVAFLLFHDGGEQKLEPVEEAISEEPQATDECVQNPAPVEPDADEDSTESADEEEPEEPKTEEELLAEEDERRVEAFDALTDKWMEQDNVEISMKDMDEFAAALKSVPDERKEECLRRALNLVSDDHFLLLAGILLDKTFDKELLSLVFHDLLNRNESVKDAILPKIEKDRDHPCNEDAKWILDATSDES